MQKFINFKNSKVFFTDQGKGNALFLIHGFLENTSIWQDIAPFLAQKNRVICVDLLGHGKSDCIGFVHTMDLFAESIFAICKHLRLRKITLIGHSLGGYVALNFAENYPTFVRGLCLLNSTSNADSDERIEIRTRAIELAKTNYESLVSMSISNLFYQKNLSLFQKEIEFLKKQALLTPVQGYIAAQEGMKIRKNTNTILQNATFKKLLIAGSNDPIIPLENSKQEAQKTNTKLEILDGGHMSFIECKVQLIAVLKSFVASFNF